MKKDCNKFLTRLFLLLILFVMELPCAAQEGICGNHVVFPQFPGGHNALFQFIQNNLFYTEKAYKEGIEGRVVVGFTVTKKGDLKDFRVLKSLEPSLDKEAFRVMKLSPRWKPGYHDWDGKVVDVKYQMPVQFRLDKTNAPRSVVSCRCKSQCCCKVKCACNPEK